MHPIRGLGVEERAAVLLEPDGRGRVVGRGSAYLVAITGSPAALKEKQPLDGATFDVQKVEARKTADMKKWRSGATPYTLVMENGIMKRYPEIGPIY